MSKQSEICFRRAVLSGILGLFAMGTASSQDALRLPSPRPEGVSPATEQAIEKGLRYLLRVREPDGSWGSTPSSPNIYPVAVTGLVGLAFLAHGDTPTRGEHAEVVHGITNYLLSTQMTNGLFDSGGEESPRARKGPRPMYGHAFAMTFLAQIYGQEGDPELRRRIREALHAAVKLTRSTQTDDGGWSYSPTYWEDEGTLTVTQLQSLRACRDAGIVVPKSIIDRGVKFIEHSSNPNGSVRYRVDPREDSRDGVTCAAVVALWNAGQYEAPMTKRTMDYVNKHIHRQWQDGKHGEYIEYYLAQAKWVMGGRLWSDFYREASSEFVGIQHSDGHWEGADDRTYGTTFATSIVLIVLQLPYNRLPVYQR